MNIITDVRKKWKDERKKESDERKLDLLKTAVGSGCNIFYDRKSGEVAIAGNFSIGTKYPVHVGIAFDNDYYLTKSQYVINMKSLMSASNLVRSQFIDDEKKYLVSSPYEMSSSDDIRFVTATIERTDPMQFVSDVMQDITSSTLRKGYSDYVHAEIKNAIEATKLASMSKISTKLQEYTDKYSYLLNSENFEHERS